MSLQEEDENKPDQVKRLLGSPPKAGKQNPLDDKNVLRYPLRKIDRKRVRP
jgi:hypothetical protein